MEKDRQLQAAREAKRVRARCELVAARAHSETLVERWSCNQAAVLASTLEPGRPCPVCGSPDHPAPAPEAAGDVPTDDELKKAEARVKKLDGCLENTQWLVAEANGAFLGRVSAVKTIEDSLGEAAATD